uniref:YqaJ viral recombinase domain-containing protein n=1 Tax=viral metagenome TaxID=1070528 RepID=A0A6C0IWN4_9ZZZZ
MTTTAVTTVIESTIISAKDAVLEEIAKRAPKAIDRSQRSFKSIEEATERLGKPIHETLRHIFDQPRIEQKSNEWLFARRNAITASDFGAAAGIAEWSNPVEIFKKKTETNIQPFNARSIEFMKHGEQWENYAAHHYETVTGNTIIDFGLMVHWRIFALRPSDITRNDWLRLVTSTDRPECIDDEKWREICDLRWLQGSPDGITTNGILVEIKCPSTSFKPGVIRDCYMAQVQLNMELANVDRCHFIQYRPPEGLLSEQFDFFEIARDRQWFLLQKENARKCWKWIEHFRNTGTVPQDLVKRIEKVATEDGSVQFRSLLTRKRSTSSVSRNESDAVFRDLDC